MTTTGAASLVSAQGVYIGSLATTLQSNAADTGNCNSGNGVCPGTNAEFDSAYVFSVQSFGTGALGTAVVTHTIGPGNNCIWRHVDKNDVYFGHSYTAAGNA